MIAMRGLQLAIAGIAAVALDEARDWSVCDGAAITPMEEGYRLGLFDALRALGNLAYAHGCPATCHRAELVLLGLRAGFSAAQDAAERHHRCRLRRTA